MKEKEPLCFWIGHHLSELDILEDYLPKDHITIRAEFDKKERLSRISLDTLETLAEKYGEFIVPYDTPIPGSITAYFSDKDCAYGDRYILQSLRELEHGLEKNAIEIAKRKGNDAVILDYNKTKIISEILGGENNFKRWFCKAKFHYEATSIATLADKIKKQEIPINLSTAKPKKFHTIG